ncbi:MAG: outer membrane beta-barrel protein [Flavobacteriales bacterium]|nr:outer membrane beta-barrel protein [Flavobacteriales bacterium]
MKKIVTVVSALVLGITAMAQTDQGTWMFGAGSNLGFTSGKENSDQEDAASQLSLDVRAGYFVIDNLAIGLDLGYSSVSVGGVAGADLGVGPYLRYYLMESKLFGELGYKIGSSSYDGNKLGSTGALGIGVGYAAWLNDNVTIEPMIKYSALSTKPDGGDSYSGSAFGVMVNFGIYLGN